MTEVDHRLPPRIAPLLAGSILLSAAVAWWGLDRLGDERHRVATVEAMAEAGARPRVPLLAKGMTFSEASRGEAAARLEDQLGKAAAGHRLLVERLDTLPLQNDRPALLTAEIALSGSEADIKRFANIIEGGTPTVRFERWRIARTAAGESTVRLEASALALWNAHD